VDPATFSWIVVFFTVSAPALAMPPPCANAQRCPHSGTALCGATLFWLMTLSLIVTVAPVASPAAGRIEIPPPKVTNESGVASLSPPVIVTRLIETVGLTTPSPIVTTGPPPSIVVAPAPEPTSCKLFKIVIPPANVPDPIAIVSPFCAASRAAWIVGKHPAFAATHNVAAERADVVAVPHTIAVAAVAAMSIVPLRIKTSSRPSLG
jgi:hypothetical protein